MLSSCLKKCLCWGFHRMSGRQLLFFFCPLQFGATPGGREKTQNIKLHFFSWKSNPTVLKDIFIAHTTEVDQNDVQHSILQIVWKVSFSGCGSLLLYKISIWLLLLLLLLSRFSRVQLCATPEMTAHQAPPSLGFSRQEHWSGLPFPSPILPYRLIVSMKWITLIWHVAQYPKYDRLWVREISPITVPCQFSSVT